MKVPAKICVIYFGISTNLRLHDVNILILLNKLAHML